MNKKQKLVLIGSSTGGPGHIKKIIQNINTSTDTIFIIAQHMNYSFMDSFVSQLDSLSKIPVIKTIEKIKLDKSSIYICAKSSKLHENHGFLYIEEVNKETPYEPYIDLLFESATKIIDKYEVTSIILTGIGNDGAKASLELYNLGATCIAESEKSAIVYGMPKQAYIQNNNIKVLSLDEIASYIGTF